jgi:putative thioredoxin
MINMFGSSSSKKAPADAAGGDSDIIKNTTTQSFVKDVMEASKTVPVIVDFWAPWCGPCKQLTPVIEKVVRAAKGKVRLVKMNIDEHPSVAGQLGVQSIPAVFAFVNGRPVDAFMGAQPESQVKQFVDRLIGDAGGDDIAEVLATADAALAAGDLQGAAETYAAILAEDKDNLEALAGLAKCYLKTGEFERAEQTLALAPPAKQSAAVIAGARALLELARKAPKPAETEALSRRVQADPNDHQARFDLALARNTEGKRAEAVDLLLEIMRRSRTWNDDAARKQLVQFFDAWGPKDPATLDGRKRLSLVLFS